MGSSPQRWRRSQPRPRGSAAGLDRVRRGRMCTAWRHMVLRGPDHAGEAARGRRTRETDRCGSPGRAVVARIQLWAALEQRWRPGRRGLRDDGGGASNGHNPCRSESRPGTVGTGRRRGRGGRPRWTAAGCGGRRRGRRARPSCDRRCRGKQEANAQSFREAGSAMGHLVHSRADGDIALHGRLKELIGRRGRKEFARARSRNCCSRSQGWAERSPSRAPDAKPGRGRHGRPWSPR